LRNKIFSYFFHDQDTTSYQTVNCIQSKTLGRLTGLERERERERERVSERERKEGERERERKKRRERQRKKRERERA